MLVLAIAWAALDPADATTYAVTFGVLGTVLVLGHELLVEVVVGRVARRAAPTRGGAS